MSVNSKVRGQRFYTMFMFTVFLVGVVAAVVDGVTAQMLWDAATGGTLEAVWEAC